MIPCNRTVANVNIILDFALGSESYFEDSTELTATLTYKSSTFILDYNKTTNSLRIPNNQQNLQDGKYNLTLFAKDCKPFNAPCSTCTFSYNFNIAYNGDIVLFVSIEPDPDPPTLTCYPGSSVTLKGTQLPTQAFKAQWSQLVNNQFIDIPGATTFSYSATQAGTYRYTLTGPAGCSGINIIGVNPPQVPEVLVQPDTQILNACAQKLVGVSVLNFGDPDNIEYNWTTGPNGIILNGSTTIDPVIGAPGQYFLEVARKDNGCTATASVLAEPGDIPVVNASIGREPATGRLDCRLKQIKLSATASQTPGTSPFTFQWSSGVSGPDFTVDTPGMYTVTVTASANGCQGATAILITQDLSKPAIQIISPRDTICDNESITLTALTQEPVMYLWNDNSTNSTNSVSPLDNGANNYAVTVTANDNGCTASVQKQIFQVDAPQVFCQESAFTVQNGEQAGLNCSTSGDLLTWLTTATNVRNIPALGEGPVSGQIFQLDNLQAPGKVVYAFYGVNAGCTSVRADVEITVLPGSAADIFIPELITPNGDGLNDYWEIVVPETIANPQAYLLRLFNRYGAQVYNGTLADKFNADTYPDGAYYYTLSTPDGETLRGAVSILRRR